MGKLSEKDNAFSIMDYPEWDCEEAWVDIMRIPDNVGAFPEIEPALLKPNEKFPRCCAHIEDREEEYPALETRAEELEYRMTFWPTNDIGEFRGNCVWLFDDARRVHSRWRRLGQHIGGRVREVEKTQKLNQAVSFVCAQAQQGSERYRAFADDVTEVLDLCLVLVAQIRGMKAWLFEEMAAIMNWDYFVTTEQRKGLTLRDTVTRVDGIHRGRYMSRKRDRPWIGRSDAIQWREAANPNAFRYAQTSSPDTEGPIVAAPPVRTTLVRGRRHVQKRGRGHNASPQSTEEPSSTENGARRARRVAALRLRQEIKLRVMLNLIERCKILEDSYARLVRRLSETRRRFLMDAAWCRWEGEQVSLASKGRNRREIRQKLQWSESIILANRAEKCAPPKGLTVSKMAVGRAGPSLVLLPKERPPHGRHRWY